MKRTYHRRLILIGWLFFAVTVLYIALCMLLPNALQLPLIMLSSIFTVPLTMEFNIKGMIAQIVGVALVCAFRFGVGVAAPYLLFLGYYPPVKFLCEQCGGPTGLLSKLMVFCFSFGLTIRMFPAPLFTAYASLPWFLFVPLLIALFFVTDFVVSMFAATYNSVLRRKLL